VGSAGEAVKKRNVLHIKNYRISKRKFSNNTKQTTGGRREKH